MFSLFEGKPDHPLFNLEETRRLIAELLEDDLAKALEDISGRSGASAANSPPAAN